MTRAEWVERMARAMCEKSLGPKQCPCFGKEFKCADAHPAFQATAALAAIEAAGFVCVPREAIDTLERIALVTMHENSRLQSALGLNSGYALIPNDIARAAIAASPLAQEARDAE